MNINLYFKEFFIPKIYIKMTLGILQTIAIVIPIAMGLLLIVRFLSIKTNIKYYEKHPEQENSQIRLAEEKQNLQIFIIKLKKYIILAIVLLLVAIGLEVLKTYKIV